MSSRVFDEGGDEWESILGHVGLSGKSVGLEGCRGGGGHVAGRPAGASQHVPALATAGDVEDARLLYQPVNQFFFFFQKYLCPDDRQGASLVWWSCDSRRTAL